MASQLDPSAVLDPDRFMQYEQSVLRSPIVDRVAGLIDRPGMSVCDVGGATGVFLGALRARADHPLRGAVLEVVGDYADKLSADDIEFIHASIVDDVVDGDRFDVVTARHVLHHLVAPTVAATAELQRRGVAGMMRLVKPGGHLVLLEEVNRVKLFSRMVYAMSRFANRRALRVRYFETGNVVVSFMTPEELRRAVERLPDAQVVEQRLLPREIQWRWRLTLLMSTVSDALVVARKLPAA